MPARIFLRTFRRAADAPFRGLSAAIPAFAILIGAAIGPASAQVAAPAAAPAHAHEAAPAAPASVAPVPAPAASVPAASAPATAAPATPTPTTPTPTTPTPATPAAAAPAEPAPAAAADPAQPHAAAPTLPATLLPHDLSPWGMFMAADKVVKAVMIGLALASIITWTLWLAKSLELAFARRTVARTLAALREEPSLADAAHEMPEGRGAPQKLVRVALGEWHASEGLPPEGIKERVSIALGRIEAGAGRRMTSGTGILATIGAIGPFVGLFGTVWGIMNSFIGISKAQTTNLAVVAPGIAEALLATAIGLVAAIPAVVIYNVFARSISAYKASLTDTSAEVLRHLSRDLDRAAQGDESVLPLRAAAE